MPRTFFSSLFITIWQVDVPMIIISRPSSTMPAAGRAACASMIGTATAVPGKRPVISAPLSVITPAFVPVGCTCVETFVPMTSAKPGCTAAQKSRAGYSPFHRLL